MPPNFRIVDSQLSPEIYIANYIRNNAIQTASVCGPSGSGKTTFAKKLCDAIGDNESMVLKVDHYWRYTRPEMKERGLTGYAWEARDKDRFLKDFALLKQGQKIDKPIFDYQREVPTNRTETVEPKKFIILEDTLDLTEISELNVFMYAPDKILVQRRLKRDAYKVGYNGLEDMETYIRTKSLPAYRRILLPVAQKVDFLVDTYNNKLLENTLDV